VQLGIQELGATVRGAQAREARARRVASGGPSAAPGGSAGAARRRREARAAAQGGGSELEQAGRARAGCVGARAAVPEQGRPEQHCEAPRRWLGGSARELGAGWWRPRRTRALVYRDVTRQAKGLYRLKHVGALWSGLAYLSRYNSGWFCHTVG
jgi:hypothetical protein